MTHFGCDLNLDACGRIFFARIGVVVLIEIDMICAR